MSWIPSFRLYDSLGTGLIYTFEDVIETNWPLENPFFIQKVNTRGAGAITIPAGTKPYDIILKARLAGTDYTDLTTNIFNLKDTVDANTRYILKINKSAIATDDINVMRLAPINFELGNKRVSWCYYTITLNALSWA